MPALAQAAINMRGTTRHIVVWESPSLEKEPTSGQDISLLSGALQFSGEVVEIASDLLEFAGHLIKDPGPHC